MTPNACGDGRIFTAVNGVTSCVTLSLGFMAAGVVIAALGGERDMSLAFLVIGNVYWAAAIICGALRPNPPASSQAE